MSLQLPVGKNGGKKQELWDGQAHTAIQNLRAEGPLLNVMWS